MLGNRPKTGSGKMLGVPMPGMFIVGPIPPRLRVPAFAKSVLSNGEHDWNSATCCLDELKQDSKAVSSIVRILLLSLLIAFSSVALADFTGKVVGVSDGDTITILTGREQVKVRLAEIDAPEKEQPFGNRAKQALAGLVFGKEVRVVTHGTDRYRRTIGRVYRDNSDVNVEMIKAGMAWVYRKYATDERAYEMESAAREQRRGLWADPNPVPPWEWRAARRRR